MLRNEAVHLCTDCPSPRASLIIESSFTEAHKNSSRESMKMHDLALLWVYSKQALLQLPRVQRNLLVLDLGFSASPCHMARYF